jgi:effector-binding domain-containing protein
VSDYDVAVKYVPMKMALVVRRSVTAEQAAEMIPQALQAIFDHIEEGGCVGAEEAMAIFPPDFAEPGEHEVAVAVTIADGIPGPGVLLEELPSGEFAWTLFSDGYESTLEGWQAVWDWAAENERGLAGPYREVYLSGPDVPPEFVEIELQQPIY